MGRKSDLSLDRSNAPHEPPFQIGFHRLRRKIHRKVKRRLWRSGMTNVR
jgi:hypothetical protein